MKLRSVARFMTYARKIIVCKIDSLMRFRLMQIKFEYPSMYPIIMIIKDFEFQNETKLAYHIFKEVAIGRFFAAIRLEKFRDKWKFNF